MNDITKNVYTLVFRSHVVEDEHSRKILTKNDEEFFILDDYGVLRPVHKKSFNHVPTNILTVDLSPNLLEHTFTVIQKIYDLKVDWFKPKLSWEFKLLKPRYDTQKVLCCYDLEYGEW